MTSTHCQICMRVIKTVRGWSKAPPQMTDVIAHHGFRRPRHGWQTASCLGAKYRPIEIACDALPIVIGQLKGYIERTQALLANFLANPPATLEYDIPRAWQHKYGPKGTVERPADFADRDIDRDHQRFMPQSYVNLYRSHRDELQGDLKNAQRDLGIFEQRLADWKPAREAA